MKRLVLLAFVLSAKMALADTLDITLTPEVMTGAAGGEVTYAGTITNPSAGTQLLNDLSIEWTAPGGDYLTSQGNFFFGTVPGTYAPSDSYVGPLFRISIAAGTPQGHYPGTVMLLGGGGFFSATVLATQAFELIVGAPPPPSATPTSTSTRTPTATPTEPPRCDPAPRSGCQLTQSSAISLTDSSDAIHDKLLWKFTAAAGASSADLGNPVSGQGVVFCLYDRTAGEATLALSIDALGASTCGSAPCWSAVRNGFRYRSHAGGGRLDVLMKMARGVPALRLKAAGDRVVLPLPASASQLLHDDPTVTAQLIQAPGLPCWEATFPSPATRNNDARFADRIR